LSTASSPPDAPRAAAVIVAGGSGLRFGGPVRKQYLEIGGVPVLLRAIRPFLAHPRIGQVIVVIPPEDVLHAPTWLLDVPVRIVAGGAERGDSVANGLGVVEDADLVLIHDGARPFVDGGIIDRVLDGCAAGGAIAAVPVTDTIKQVDTEGVIAGTPDRRTLWQAQTPQGFPLGRLRDAYRRAAEEGIAATDDAALYERYVGPVRVVMGSYRNLKVTRPDDLPIAEAIAAETRDAT
jgi:2-C-methyl-D-erythritol 4-phosphate cytidylyltransferase